jgi:hypothetical protein
MVESKFSNGEVRMNCSNCGRSDQPQAQTYGNCRHSSYGYKGVYMKNRWKIKIIDSIIVLMIAIGLFVVSPVSASKSVAVPPLQSGVTLTATGQYCPALGCSPWNFDFYPSGGPVVGYFNPYGLTNATKTSDAELVGYFEGGDWGKVSGTWSYSITFPSGVEYFRGTWDGRLSSDGTGTGELYTENGDPVVNGWSVTFDARAFQAALGEEPIVGVTPTGVSAIAQEVQLDSAAREFISTSLPLNQATAAILNQDSVILARDANNNFYAINNQGKAIPLPSEIKSVFQLNDHFGILGDDRLLASSEHSSVRGTINGGGDFVFLNKIPDDLKERDYAMLTTTCSSTACQSQMWINSTASSAYIQGGALDTGAQQVCKPGSTSSEPLNISSLRSSEHSSVRGTINGGG